LLAMRQSLILSKDECPLMTQSGRCQQIDGSIADHPPKGTSLALICLSKSGPIEVKGRLYAAMSSTDSAMPVAKRVNAMARARRLSLWKMAIACKVDSA